MNLKMNHFSSEQSYTTLFRVNLLAGSYYTTVLITSVKVDIARDQGYVVLVALNVYLEASLVNW